MNAGGDCAGAGGSLISTHPGSVKKRSHLSLFLFVDLSLWGGEELEEVDILPV